METDHNTVGASEGGATGDSASDGARRAAEVLGAILERMGYDLPVEVQEQDDRILLTIGEGGDQALIGDKGETLDALQYLVSRVVTHNEGVRDPVVVDCGGYRDRRREALQTLARDLGDKARQTGRTVALNPLSAHDRRIVHMTLRDEPGVCTRSEGGGLFKRVLIEPEGA